MCRNEIWDIIGWINGANFESKQNAETFDGINLLCEMKKV